MVPFSELPVEQQAKDFIFRACVHEAVKIISEKPAVGSELEEAIIGALNILDPKDVGAPVPGSPGQNINAIAILRKAIGRQ